MITKVPTKDMPREVWLERRKRSIGGSDAGTILGMNSYNSPYALWAEKTNKIIPDDISCKETVRLGNDLEEYVANRWCEAVGKKVRRENNMLYNDKYPFAHADIDRAVIGEKAGLECKTTSSFEIAKKCEGGEIPDVFYAQCVHYMAVTGWERWYIGILCFGKGFYHFCIERDEDEIAALMNAEREFWRFVENKTPPMTDGTEATSKAISTIYSESGHDGAYADLSSFNSDLAAYTALSAQIKELEAKRDTIANNIKAFMGDCGAGSSGTYKVSWATQGRRVFDAKAFTEDYPTLDLDKYYKRSTARPFKVSEIK